MAAAGGHSLELGIILQIHACNDVDQRGSGDLVDVTKRIMFIFLTSFVVLVAAPGVVSKGPVHRSPNAVNNGIGHLYGGGHHLHALALAAADRDIDDILESAGAVTIHDFHRAESIVGVHSEVLVLVSEPPADGTDLLIAVVAPSVYFLIPRDQGEVIAMADDSIDIVDLLAVNGASIILQNRAPVHPDQTGGVVLIILHPHLRQGDPAVTQLTVEVGTHGPHSAVGQQDCRSTHGSGHVHDVVKVSTGKAQHTARRVLIVTTVAHAQLAISVITPSVDHALLGNGQHMVGTRSRSNKLGIGVGEVDLHRISAIGQGVGIVTQLAMTVVAPSIHRTGLIHGHSKAVAGGDPQDILEVLQFRIGGVLFIVGELNRCSQHGLLAAGTQLTHTGNVTLGIPEAVVTPSPDGAVLLQGSRSILAQHQLRVCHTVSDDDPGKGSLTGNGILDHDLGLALTESKDLSLLRVVRVPRYRSYRIIQRFPFEAICNSGV